MRGRTVLAAPSWISPRPHEWVLLGIGSLLVIRYRWLIDDAFIYFRYVDNLLFLHTGLVFNAGEFVEGFSSPMQVVVLTALRAMRLDWFDIVTGLGVVCFATFGLMLVRLNRELSPPGPVFNLPLAVLATAYGPTSYFTSGLETPLVHVVAAAVALRLVGPRCVALTAVVALAPLVRPELLVAVALTILFCWWREGRLPWLLVIATTAANFAWLAFRVYYYADLLPNTFYLKDDTQWTQGLYYAADLLRGVPVLPLAVALAVLWTIARWRGRWPTAVGGYPRIAMMSIAFLVGAYVVRIGGAELHYWYLAFPFTLMVCASAGCVEALLRALRDESEEAPAWIGIAAVLIGLCVAADKPPQLRSHPFYSSELGDRIGVIADASYHRHHPSLRPESWRNAVRIESMREFAPHLATGGYRNVISGIWCRTHWAQYRDRVVHGFGLTDPILARVRTWEMIPGHKPRLMRLAEDLAPLRSSGVYPGLARQAVTSGTAPEWIANNLATIEILERKMANRHQWRENVALALTFPPDIVLSDSVRDTGGAAVEPPPGTPARGR